MLTSSIVGITIDLQDFLKNTVKLKQLKLNLFKINLFTTVSTKNMIKFADLAVKKPNIEEPASLRSCVQIMRSDKF